jgi:teichuronic acid biosynthesis glycosyltransferase TuaH
VGQGCELDMFSGFQSVFVPTDIQKIPSLKIGYVGALLGLRLDIDLLYEIASKRPDWSMILVGPEDESFEKSNLHHLPNVFFLGSKLPNELPAYINEFDICLNPQIISQVTIGNYPRKIDEYLAMGKPVIATSTPFMEAVFSEHTYLGKNSDEYIFLIEKAVTENNNEKRAERKRFAGEHTWENSVQLIYEAIKKVE